MNFSQAIQVHTEWKSRLQALSRGRSSEKIDAATVMQDRSCELGRWLYGEGQKYAADPKLRELMELHVSFHQCAGAIAEMVERGQAAEAAALLSTPDSEFNRLSLRVIAILMGLRSRYRDG